MCDVAGCVVNMIYPATLYSHGDPPSELEFECDCWRFCMNQKYDIINRKRGTIFRAPPNEDPSTPDSPKRKLKAIGNTTIKTTSYQRTVVSLSFMF